ncbi:ABC transporter [Streptomyces koyangensis]|uniref:ABC transporter n=1 Tax=Streptomyces koyangensis TaxID=188770 RepID=UPI003653E623|nr:ABC transporter [Streptomyces albidoflavus]
MTATLTPAGRADAPAPASAARDRRAALPRAVLRLHRGGLVVGAALVGLFTLLLLGALLWRSAYSPAEVAACGTGSGCPGLNSYGTAHSVFWSLLQQSQNVLLLVPLVIAAYAAGPLTARERELGTHHLLWTQSAASPVRWLRSTLALGSVAVAVGAVLLVMVYRTAVAPMEGVWGFGGWVPGGYAASGPVLVAYCLLGMGLGVCAGTLIGRTLPAVFAGVAGTGLLLVAGTFGRPWIWPVSDVVVPFTRDRSAWPTPGAHWPEDASVRGQWLMTGDGTRIDLEPCYTAPGGIEGCAVRAGAENWLVEFHPVAHRLPMQLVESGVVLLAAALAVAAAFLVLRRQTH